MTVKAFDTDRRTNGQLIADCFELGYLRDEYRILDPTYGLGRWWSEVDPPYLTAHDLDPEKAPHGPMDFTALHYEDRIFDAVTFDPPYKLCLDTETEVLTRRGWLTHEQVEVGDIAYSLNHDTGGGEWRRITAVNRYDRSPTEVRVCAGKNLDFVATPDHRWPVLSAKGQRVWKVTDALSTGDRVVQAARWAGTPVEATLDDALVELIAWFWTEGSVDWPSTYTHITQSHAVNAEHCEAIARALEKLYGPRVSAFPRTGRTSEPMWRVRDEDRNRRFILSAAVGAELLRWAPAKIPSLKFYELLTAEQLNLFINVSLAADGQSPTRLAQANPAAAESFALACLLSGRSVSMHWRDDGNGTTITIRHRHSKPSRPGVMAEARDVAVWCPTVEGTGTWLARRRGRVYFTGNSGTPELGHFDYAYGVHEARTVQQRLDLIVRGLEECIRVTKVGGRVLVKVQDQVVSGNVVWQTNLVAEVALRSNCRVEDMLHVSSYRPQPPGRRQQHAAHNYSTLLVLKRLP